MQAVVLSAGEGKRMRPLTFTRPKVMLPIANKPILQHLVENLIRCGVDEIVLVVGYREETIREHFGEEFEGVKIKYVRQSRQLGTAHALLSAEHLLEDSFIMLNGDSIVFEEGLRKIMKEENAIAVKEIPNPQNFGVVELEGEKIKGITEKPDRATSNLINAGIYTLTKSIVEYLKKTPISVRGEYEITDSINIAIRDGMEFRAVVLERWLDIGYPWDMLRANEFLLSEIERDIRGEVENGAVIEGDVVIGENTIIKSGSYIEGPVSIGRNCRIGPNCFIRPFSSIGDNCHIGHAVEVKNSIIMRNTKIPHFNYVGDSIIGENCNLGAGTKIANLRLDEREISAVQEGKIVKTGRKKFGAAIGDDVKTGINVSINAGTLIGNDVTIAPGAIVEGWIAPNSRIF